MKYLRETSLSVAVLFSAAVVSLGQTPCKPPEMVLSGSAGNMFTEEQDLFLGDALAETIDKELAVISDEAAAGYLTELGERIARHLPPTAIKFRFFVVDAPELNAFSVAGGRIYVTRKLIAFVKSEDELAGILGHEMGHAVVRHHSSDISKAFREILKVDRLHGREDVYNRVHQLMDRYRTKRIKQKSGHEDGQQLEADRIGLYAMTAAGFDPEANVSAWERLTEIRRGEERRGLFGNSRPEHKRLREMLNSIKGLSVECREQVSVGRAEAFRNWRSYIVSLAKIRHAESLPGLTVRNRLSPYLRGSVTHLQFSRDGKYAIAQDASGINVLRREPFSFLFRINIAGAKPAKFSPDSKSIIVQTYALRVEEWNVESRRRTMVQEAYVRDRCAQTELSPDGKTLVCYSVVGDLHLIDVATSNKVFSKEKFYLPPGPFGGLLLMAMNTRFGETDLMEMEFSPDGRYFLAGAVSRVSITGNVPWAIVSALGLDRKAFLAFDVATGKELKVPDPVKQIAGMPFTFYANDKIVGQHLSDKEKSGIFTFPEGERVEKFFLSGSSYEKATGGDHLIVRPIESDPAGVYNISLKKFVLSSKSSAVDAYGDVFLTEGLNGSVELSRVSNGGEPEKIGTVSLPKNDLGDIRAVAVSPDLDRIALSERTRGGVWDLTTGERKIYVRGFQGAHIDPDGVVYADLPAFENELRSIAALNVLTGTAKALRTLGPERPLQTGRYLANLLPANAKDGESSFYYQRPMRITGLGVIRPDMPDMRLDVNEASSGKLLWSRKFDSEPPDYFFSPDGKTVTFRWLLSDKTAAEIIRKSPELSEKARAMGEKATDYLFEVLNAEHGNVLGRILIETGEGSIRIQDAFTVADTLALIDTENRVVFYSLKTGEMKGRVFGEDAVLDPSGSIALIKNFPGVLSIEDLDSGKNRGQLRFSSPIAHVQFSSDGGRLFVLTASQEYFLFDTIRMRQP